MVSCQQSDAHNFSYMHGNKVALAIVPSPSYPHEPQRLMGLSHWES